MVKQQEWKPNKQNDDHTGKPTTNIHHNQKQPTIHNRLNPTILTNKMSGGMLIKTTIDPHTDNDGTNDHRLQTQGTTTIDHDLKAHITEAIHHTHTDPAPRAPTDIHQEAHHPIDSLEVDPYQTTQLGDNANKHHRIINNDNFQGTT